jgi:hypothetical protein
VLLFLRRYKKNAKIVTMMTAAATPTPIPAAAPLESDEDVLVFGVEVVLVADVGADVAGVVNAGIEEDEDEVVAITL